MHERCRVYTISPDVGQRLEKSCTHEWCTHGKAFSHYLAGGQKNGLTFFIVSSYVKINNNKNYYFYIIIKNNNNNNNNILLLLLLHS
jgi:hypothetical protein